MPLFVTERDRKLLSKVNRELIDDIIASKIVYYQISELDSTTNIYGETPTKFFKQSFIIPCMIEREEQEYSYEEGKLDYEIQSQFYILRDYLLDKSIKIDVGNYIQYDTEFFEIDAVIENKYYGDKNPATSLVGSNYGWDVTIQCRTHLIDRSSIQLEQVRFD